MVEWTENLMAAELVGWMDHSTVALMAVGSAGLSALPTGKTKVKDDRKY